jgi:hypothetical protein
MKKFNIARLFDFVRDANTISFRPKTGSFKLTFVIGGYEGVYRWGGEYRAPLRNTISLHLHNTIAAIEVFDLSNSFSSVINHYWIQHPSDEDKVIMRMLFDDTFYVDDMTGYTDELDIE